MTREVKFLQLDDLVDVARMLLGDPPPIRDIGLLGSAAARPQTSIGGQDAYDELCTKAAALLQSIVKNQFLIDGNKRLRWLATAVFLALNDASVDGASTDDVYCLAAPVAASHLSLVEIAAELRRFGSMHG